MIVFQEGTSGKRLGLDGVMRVGPHGGISALIREQRACFPFLPNMCGHSWMSASQESSEDTLVPTSQPPKL